jgi:hypothetical protein
MNYRHAVNPPLERSLSSAATLSSASTLSS